MYDSKPVTMKRKDTIINILIFVVIVGGALVYRYMQSVVPYWQCSEVYKRYHKVEGVRASYIKNFPLNDTLTIGVTLLEATTDSGWAMLQEDFGLPVIPKELEELFCGDSNKVSVKCIPKKTPLYMGGDTLVNDWIAISRYKRRICHFVIESKEQMRLIVHKNVDENIESDSITYYNTNLIN